MAPKSSLLGPPELHLRKPVNPQPGHTENGFATYVSSGNPCLDFFFHVVPDTPFESVQDRLREAWNYDPLTTLKLICNLRGVRGTGKSDKEGFYAAALWLHEFHPETLAFNIPSMANFGYFKDFPEILYRVLEGSDVRKIQKDEWEVRKREFERHTLVERGRLRRQRGPSEKSGRIRKPYTGNGLTRDEKKLAMAKKALEKYDKDSNFRLLHESVSDFFSGCLRVDMENLKSGQVTKVSLAAKWCPSLDSSFDRSTLLCESIARKVFPREPYPEYEGVEEAHYAYRIRDRLRKEVLVPLRKVLELPEVYIGQNKWGGIPYNRVASVAMKFYTNKFLKHDSDRFRSYLNDVKSGKAKIAAGALLPHEILKPLIGNDDDIFNHNYDASDDDSDDDDDKDGGNDAEKVAELQWKRMVDDLLREGKLRNCLAVFDVSGSMNGTPMEVSIALGLLVSELSEEPWKGKVISFSEDPTLHIIEGGTLLKKVRSIKRMEWGNNTDFRKVFDRILKVAVKGGLKEDQMIKRVFVFSDMEFDQASERPWETDYETIVRKFTKKGYGNSIPEIVFWNLRDSKATPVPSGQKGVALVSGFSKNLMKLFLDGNSEIGPVSVMEVAISGEEYQKLAVID